MDKTAFLEEAVGGVVTEAGFKINPVNTFLPKPGSCLVQKRLSRATAAETFPDQKVADHPERSVAVFLDLRDAESFNHLSFSKFPHSGRASFNMPQYVFHPFFAGILSRARHKGAVHDFSKAYSHLDFTVGNILWMVTYMADKQVGKGGCV